jgi:hypothetical protein
MEKQRVDKQIVMEEGQKDNLPKGLFTIKEGAIYLRRSVTALGMNLNRDTAKQVT